MWRRWRSAGWGDGFSVVGVKDPPHFVEVLFSPAPEWFRR
jgi:hypothetical protein